MCVEWVSFDCVGDFLACKRWDAPRFVPFQDEAAQREKPFGFSFYRRQICLDVLKGNTSLFMCEWHTKDENLQNES